MRESCMSGSVKGASSNRRLYSILRLPRGLRDFSGAPRPCGTAMGGFGQPEVSAGLSMGRQARKKPTAKRRLVRA